MQLLPLFDCHYRSPVLIALDEQRKNFWQFRERGGVGYLIQ